ncbi:MAG: hypothetical protein V1783_01325 [Bacteroidota bacterium]|jgi:hypothetical protein
MNKKNFGLLLLGVGIFGFFYFSGRKKDFMVEEQHFAQNKIHSFNLETKENSNFTMFFWLVDEESGIQMSANADAVITVSDQNGMLIKREEIIAHSSGASNGIRKAQNSFEFHYISTKKEYLLIQINLLKGDYIDVEIYEDLPANLNIIPGISIIIGIIGFVIFLRARAKS